MYLSDSLTCKSREDISNLICTNDGNLESVFVEVVLKSRKNIVIGCVYKHPLMGIDLFNNQYLSPVLKSIEHEGKSLTLLGDFNLWFQIIGAHQMLPSINLPTRITDTSSTIIDNIFISPTDSNILSGNQFLYPITFLNLFSLVSNLRLVINHPWDFVVTGRNSIANNSKTNLKTWIGKIS